MKKLISISVLFALVLSGSDFALADNNGRGDENKNEHALTSVSPTASASPIPANTCMTTAVDTRDTAIIAAWDAYTPAVRAILVARKNALKAAWLLTGRKARRVAIHVAWSDYKNALHSARRIFRTGKSDAWTKFRTDRLACQEQNGQSQSDSNGSGIDENL